MSEPVPDYVNDDDLYPAIEAERIVNGLYLDAAGQAEKLAENRAAYTLGAFRIEIERLLARIRELEERLEGGRT